jgi:uncharacterized spore protein YtfJ
LSDVEVLLKATFGEMMKVMAAKTVVGDAVTVGDKTVIPLVTVGMGFGAGSVEGKAGSLNGAAGGGVGIKPIGVIIMDSDGVRIEHVSSALPSAVDRLTEAVPKIIDAIPKLIGKHGQKEDRKPQIKAESIPPEHERLPEGKEKVTVKVE